MTSPISNNPNNQVFNSREKPSVKNGSETTVKQESENATSAVGDTVNVDNAAQVLKQETDFNTSTSLNSAEQAKAAVSKLVDQLQQNPQQAVSAFANTGTESLAGSI